MRKAVWFTTLAMLVGMIGLVATPASAATITVDDDEVECPAPDHNTIGAAIAAATAGDTINVCPGTYAENVVLNKSLTLNGAQTGVDARGRVASESVIAPAAGIGIDLRDPTGGTVVDGFTVSGGAQGIRSTSGILNDLLIANNRIVGFTGSGLFLDNSGPDATLNQNLVDGASKTGGGGLVHLDQDNFDGLHFTSNEVQGYGIGTGFFVDGNHNVGPSAARTPLFDGNLLDGAGTGTNLGRFAFELGDITNNTFSNNASDGLQGGIQNSLIDGNVFEDNGRSGLALTGFGGAVDPTRGAQNTDITNNEFTGNGFTNPGEALFFTSGQFPGTISTNEAHDNNIEGNADGARYSGGETINVECNWWGSFTGPSGDGPGTGDTVQGAGLDFEPWLIASAPGGDCAGPLPLPTSKDDCKKDGWMDYTDDQNRPFANQGDCVSYVASGGSNKASG